MGLAINQRYIGKLDLGVTTLFRGDRKEIGKNEENWKTTFRNPFCKLSMHFLSPQRFVYFSKNN